MKNFPFPLLFRKGNSRPENFENETKFIFERGRDKRWGRPNHVPSRIYVCVFLYIFLKKYMCNLHHVWVFMTFFYEMYDLNIFYLIVLYKMYHKFIIKSISSFSIVVKFLYRLSDFYIFMILIIQPKCVANHLNYY